MIEPCEVVVLTKVPAAGKVKTRLGQDIGMEVAAGLARAMLRDVLAGAEAALVPERDRLWVCHAPDDAPPQWFRDLVAEAAPSAGLRPQGSGDLGQRLARALDSPGPRLVLGSDLPELPPAELRAALGALGAQPLVMGPAVDGGYYLLGLAAGVSAAPLRAGVRWSHAETRGDTLAAFARAGFTGVHDLQPRRDVDDLGSLDDLRRRLVRGQASAPATHAWLLEHPRLFASNPLHGPD